ncbi:MAG: tetraacyldisaccharide 4'-kinase [Ferruginibacter sp.]
MLKSFRYLLIPFSFVYGFIIWIRNWLYDKNILKSAGFNFPIICVGNLAVGGTGKTPMVEYLVELLQGEYQVATLSRGYKRKTKGFGIADESTTALEIGDEPMQFHQKFPGITVAVGEERLTAVPMLLDEVPETQCIILDDAFQHRPVVAGLNIILTEFKNLYTRDFLMPAGDLRDNRKSALRADIIVVTKCKSDLSLSERDAIIKEINPAQTQLVFFTSIEYTRAYHLFTKDAFDITPDMDLLLVCGIANPKPLQEYLDTSVHSFDMLKYPDHHIFSIDNLDEIKRQFEQIHSTNKIIVTTEKDGVRLQKFGDQLKDFPVYVLPIRHAFLFDEGKIFEDKVRGFISSVKKGSRP